MNYDIDTYDDVEDRRREVENRMDKFMADKNNKKEAKNGLGVSGEDIPNFEEKDLDVSR